MDNLTEEQKRAIALDNAKEVDIKFTKGELILIFNILTKVDMRYGDALVIVPLVKKIEPHVVVASNITEMAKKAESNHQEVILNKKN